MCVCVCVHTHVRMCVCVYTCTVCAYTSWVAASFSQFSNIFLSLFIMYMHVSMCVCGEGRSYGGWRWEVVMGEGAMGGRESRQEGVKGNRKG